MSSNANNELTGVIAIPEEGLLERIQEYTKWLERQPTAEVCRCIWRVLTDESGVVSANAKKQLIDVNPTCPMHSTDGKLFYFITEWNGCDTIGDNR